MTIVFAALVFVAFIALYIGSSIYTMKKHPTYHFEEGEFTNVCVYKRYKSYSEYRTYKFRRTIDGTLKFELGPWLIRLILKILAIDVIATVVILIWYYYDKGAIEGEDIYALSTVILLASVLIWFSEWFILARAKYYIRKNDL